MKREEVLEHLKPITGVTVRTIEHNPRTKVVVMPEQVVLRPGGGGHIVPLDEQGVKSLSTFVGLPVTTAERLSPELYGRVTTELLGRAGHYSVLLSEQKIVDFSKPTQARNLSPERLIDTIERVIPGAEYDRVVTTKDYGATIEVVGDKREPVNRGDLVRAGAMVKFSPINAVVPTVQSFVVRLACTNGALDNHILREFKGGGEGDNIWQWFRQSIKDAYGAIDDIVNRYREMSNDSIPPERRALMLEDMLNKAKIGGEVADAVRARAIEDPPQNAYDMFNLITWASTHLLKEPAQISRARSVAASFVSESEHHTFCPVCRSRH